MGTLLPSSTPRARSRLRCDALASCRRQCSGRLRTPQRREGVRGRGEGAPRCDAFESTRRRGGLRAATKTVGGAGCGRHGFRVRAWLAAVVTVRCSAACGAVRARCRSRGLAPATGHHHRARALWLTDATQQAGRPRRACEEQSPLASRSGACAAAGGGEVTSSWVGSARARRLAAGGQGRAHRSRCAPRPR